MKIATITIFCNEEFRLNNWKELYNEYKDDVALHVIVNNGCSGDTKILQDNFPNSLVIESKTNNMMASYNLALTEILRDPEINAIMQICNDIRLEKGGLRKLYDFLYSKENYAMVSPVLLMKNSEIIDSYGADINKWTLAYTHKYSGMKLSSVDEDVIVCKGLPAGVFLAKRNCYVKYGFQDEGICMYADEVDMSINAHKFGYTFATTKTIKSWHQHIYSPNKVTRSVSAYYFMGRNHIYIAQKRCNILVYCFTTLDRLRHYCISMMVSLFHKDGRIRRENASYFLQGISDAVMNREPKF